MTHVHHAMLVGSWDEHPHPIRRALGQAERRRMERTLCALVAGEKVGRLFRAWRKIDSGQYLSIEACMANALAVTLRHDARLSLSPET